MTKRKTTVIIDRFEIIEFENYLKEKTELKNSSIQTYKDSIIRLLSQKKFDKNNLEDYNNFLVKYSIKKRCSHYYSAIKHYIRFAIKDTTTRNKLLDGLRLPAVHHNYKQERKKLTRKEILNVYNNLTSKKHKIICLIQHLTGARVRDVLRIRRGNITSEEYNDNVITKIIIIGKGDKRNVVYIHDDIAQKLIWDFITHNIHKQMENYYFLEQGKMKNRKGSLNDENKLCFMNYKWYWEDLKQSLQTCGIDKNDFATHDFRRCFASEFWDLTHDIVQLKKMLNHENINVTMQYLRHSGQDVIEGFKKIQTK